MTLYADHLAVWNSGSDAAREASCVKVGDVDGDSSTDEVVIATLGGRVVWLKLSELTTSGTSLPLARSVHAGAVKNLNRVEAELASVTRDTAPFLVAGLKEREQTFRNSATLNEHYFASLGGDGRLPGEVASAIGAAFGFAGRFEELLRASALSLAGGSGWVVLVHDLYRDGLVLCWSGGHQQNHAVGLPLLVLDMFEHSYHLDYGAVAAKYVDAFWDNVDWEAVGKRMQAARKAAAAMRG